MNIFHYLNLEKSTLTNDDCSDKSIVKFLVSHSPSNPPAIGMTRNRHSFFTSAAIAWFLERILHFFSIFDFVRKSIPRAFQIGNWPQFFSRARLYPRTKKATNRNLKFIFQDCTFFTSEYISPVEKIICSFPLIKLVKLFSPSHERKFWPRQNPAWWVELRGKVIIAGVVERETEMIIGDREAGEKKKDGIPLKVRFTRWTIFDGQ